MEVEAIVPTMFAVVLLGGKRRWKREEVNVGKEEGVCSLSPYREKMRRYGDEEEEESRVSSGSRDVESSNVYVISTDADLPPAPAIFTCRVFTCSHFFTC